MKQSTGIAVAVIAAAMAAGAGYWLGHKSPATQAQGTVSATAAAVDTGAGSAQKKLLYYRNPMGLPDTSPTPKKDPMGMDYIAVFEGGDDDEPAGSSQIRISTEKVQKLGVRTEPAELRALDKMVRASGRIEPDERRLYTIAPKFEGYVERLHVNVTGQPVGRGQPLFEVYSPELVAAQREYAIAVQGVTALKGADGQAQSGMQQLAESSLLRLRNWDISEAQVKALTQSGESKRTLTFRSPVAGIVMEKKAVQGMRFMPGEMLYQVADLSRVWVIADVFEQDIGLIKSGAKARVRINAYPDKEFTGTVTYIYPTLQAETRTVSVRVELANPGLLLKPAMFAQVEVLASAKGKVVTVPVSAVIDSGTRQIVLIQTGEGRFEPRDVRLGLRSDSHVEILEGVKEGEAVVVAANFLIDAESNLRAAIGGFGSAAPAAPVPATSAAGHQAQGTVDSIDPTTGAISLSHGPVASLKWPAMTMEFKAANDALLKDLKPGARVEFEFVERQAGEWVITRVKPMVAGTAVMAPAPNPHAGH
ncbi:MAG: efflux RND transporter periplasmic adaptor subunit [Gammaproteobacteria bacterium]|uniref:efflux RND transporter periplasmic adaptor subunit n=1 Tax=Rhodoferax sp. TaxID=50421 RepID=UPI00183A71EF|nr:efflux RND transporter periplasmic adaptor subunit [Rhodoferax sp.]MBU3898379.1 efflux RND transporter periplasmic adaptor subunit [Gammaproteobacteria bacterium]MBA3059356.1 efflux RND transporter periplasmic adaptor subunit [Rhodoferax sp.]MBU3998098.1 efflux RND transporter periplasmic adaptor subunit [Gammaproteobacteria bacterium]MBU4079153.1 efflux RND transporter periplasmic adaptor subunit [Gammaproteobacteria bacterium]MBU4113782.1 efflux RND transporter periplasmic adaptor subunit